MGKETGISWTDATWNVARGCSKVSEGCRYCYMMRDGEKFGYDGFVVQKTKTVFDMPLKYKQTKSKCWGGNPLIFTSSLTDVFHPDIDSFRGEIWDIIRRCPHLAFQILTKRPERILQHLPDDWGDGYPNVWLGISAENDEMFRKRMFELIKAKVKFVSCEPLLDEIDLKYVIEKQQTGGDDRLDWVIIGGESGNETGKYLYRPCKIGWMDQMVEDCKKYDVPVFVKQMGTSISKNMGMRDRAGADVRQFPTSLQVQEFPKSYMKP